MAASSSSNHSVKISTDENICFHMHFECHVRIDGHIYPSATHFLESVKYDNSEFSDHMQWLNGGDYMQWDGILADLNEDLEVLGMEQDWMEDVDRRLVGILASEVSKRPRRYRLKPVPKSGAKARSKFLKMVLEGKFMHDGKPNILGKQLMNTTGPLAYVGDDPESNGFIAAHITHFRNTLKAARKRKREEEEQEIVFVQKKSVTENIADKFAQAAADGTMVDLASSDDDSSDDDAPSAMQDGEYRVEGVFNNDGTPLAVLVTTNASASSAAASSAAASSSSASSSAADPLKHVKRKNFKTFFPDWTIEAVVRKNGKSAGHCDYFYVSPGGKKFRSIKQVKSYLYNLPSEQ